MTITKGRLRCTTLLALVGLAPAAAAQGNCGSRSCPTPVNYCQTSPNSVGSGAVISWTGTPSLVTDDLYLASTGCPAGEMFIYFYGGVQLGLPFGNGWRCVGNGGVGLYRFSPLVTDSIGAATMKVDWSMPPSGGGSGRWLPGDTWYCQGWYRDPAGGGTQVNLTNGLAVQVCLDGPYDEMVLIPAGTFDMGDHSGTGAWNEHPVHSVYVDAFYMDVYEVSNQKYADYLNTAYAQGLVRVWSDVVYQVGGALQALCDTTASSIWSRITWNGSTFGVTGGKGDHPMMEVSWYGACAYANQRSRDHGLIPCYDETTWDCDFNADGYRLPTEAEWEYAARGGTYPPYTVYHWGNTIDGSKANYMDSGDPYETGGFPWTSPVGYYDSNQIPTGVDMANGYGLYDIAGNAREWCWDLYDPDYYSNSPPSNPTGPTSGSRRIARGGDWYTRASPTPSNLRTANRDHIYLLDRDFDLGFRVVAVRP